MWSRFNTQTRRHIWIEVVGSSSCSEGILGVSLFFFSFLKNTHFQISIRSGIRGPQVTLGKQNQFIISPISKWKWKNLFISFQSKANMIIFIFYTHFQTATDKKTIPYGVVRTYVYSLCTSRRVPPLPLRPMVLISLQGSCVLVPITEPFTLIILLKLLITANSREILSEGGRWREV